MSSDPVLAAARKAYAAGLCTVPPAENGTKRPLPDASGKWERFKTERPAGDLLKGWWPGRRGLGIVTGAVSGCVDAWDFDTRHAFEAFVAAAMDAGLGEFVERIDDGYPDDTPGGGVRWLVRYPEEVRREPGDRIILARRPGREGEPKIKTLIELPAYVVIAPSNGPVHPSGKPYLHVSGGFDSIASYTAEEREALIELARTFDAMPTTVVGGPAYERGSAVTRPGDIWATRTSWADILTPHGWTAVFMKNDVTYWRRPNKKIGISATTNHGGSDLLYVFSTSTEFEAEKSYTKFGGYTILNHGGDFAVAARALASQGYSEPAARERFHVAPERAAEDGGPLGPSNKLYRLIDDVEAESLPAPEWGIEPIYPHGGLGLLYGPRGKGKTFLALAWAFSHASGKDWLGHAARVRAHQKLATAEAEVASAEEAEAAKQRKQAQAKIEAALAEHGAKLSEAAHAFTKLWADAAGEIETAQEHSTSIAEIASAMGLAPVPHAHDGQPFAFAKLRRMAAVAADFAEMQARHAAIMSNGGYEAVRKRARAIERGRETERRAFLREQMERGGPYADAIAGRTRYGEPHRLESPVGVPPGLDDGRSRFVIATRWARGRTRGSRCRPGIGQ